MGSPPPPDGLPGPDQDALDVDAGFAPGPPVASLCGFAIPSFIPKFGLKLPSFSLPPALPKFKLALSISCDLNNPIDVTAGVSFGGGRKPSFDPDPDFDE